MQTLNFAIIFLLFYMVYYSEGLRGTNPTSEEYYNNIISIIFNILITSISDFKAACLNVTTEVDLCSVLNLFSPRKIFSLRHMMVLK